MWQSFISVAAGILVLALLSVFLVIFRRHRWTLEKDGIAIQERPKVPLTGLSHRAFVTYGDIVAFCEVESGFDHLIEIVARNGVDETRSGAPAGPRQTRL